MVFIFIDINLVTFEIKARLITITGPRGSLTRSFRHASISIIKMGKQRIMLEKVNSTTRDVALLNTISSHITNMIKGVTKRYVIRAISRMFPIGIDITENGTKLTIEKLFGGLEKRNYSFPQGVTIRPSGLLKDEYYVEGNDIELVSRSGIRSLVTVSLFFARDV
ncbi:60S ribosomal protein L9-like [Octopus sinensis]|uniref:Large ribosomal subunit protein uL6 n=1 Tax=Octopus sinensis TaxID=2607531 RepID=A0A7E6EJG8_9MOLL|nr:60S ribosomal protein L9-like [Octopus sinensis]